MTWLCLVDQRQAMPGSTGASGPRRCPLRHEVSCRGRADSCGADAATGPGGYTPGSARLRWRYAGVLCQPGWKRGVLARDARARQRHLPGASHCSGRDDESDVGPSTHARWRSVRRAVRARQAESFISPRSRCIHASSSASAPTVDRAECDETPVDNRFALPTDVDNATWGGGCARAAPEGATQCKNGPHG